MNGNENKDVVYGDLIVFGTNGELPGGNKRRRRSSFTLRRRAKPNGVKPSEEHKILTHPSDCEAYNSKDHHSVSYTLQKKVVVVPYVHDESTDMFQIGRSTEEQIDYVVMDIMPGSSIPNHRNKNQQPQQSTISRFACRIVCDRKPPYTARIYAAGFDSSMNILLGEKAPKWQGERGVMDGLTTNGVLIMQPESGFNLKCEPRSWKEASVCGNMFSLRSSRSAPKSGEKLDNADNILRDGTLIDLCGTTLLWRSYTENGDMMPVANPHNIDLLIYNLNQERPQCPVGLSTLAFPGRSRAMQQVSEFDKKKQPWVYLTCGHVHGWIDWGECGEDERICPLCRSEGKYVPLWVGSEPAFYVDTGVPSHCFVPCGHICSEKTAIYWSKTTLPHGTQAYAAACPFCATPLDDPGILKLIWQKPLD